MFKLWTNKMELTQGKKTKITFSQTFKVQENKICNFGFIRYGHFVIFCEFYFFWFAQPSGGNKVISVIWSNLDYRLNLPWDFRSACSYRLWWLRPHSMKFLHLVLLINWWPDCLLYFSLSYLLCFISRWTTFNLFCFGPVKTKWQLNRAAGHIIYFHLYFVYILQSSSQDYMNYWIVNFAPFKSVVIQFVSDFYSFQTNILNLN